MDVRVSSRHTDVSESLRNVAIEKIGRLDRFDDGLERAEVHFDEERNPRIADKEICEVNLFGGGHHIRCKVAAPDGFAAVDRAVEKLEPQLSRLKTKQRRHIQAGETVRVAASRNGVVEDEEATMADAGYITRRGELVKRKRFALKPLSVEEAALEMELLDHDFFFFTHTETGRGAVLYRRDDGDMGLIDQAD